MNFFSNRIVNPTGESITWDQYLEKLASEAKPECDDDPRGQCRGQVINNDNEPEAHSYQEGESVDGKPDQAEGSGHDPKKTEPKSAGTSTAVKEADCGKDMGECGKAGDITEEHSDAGNADVGNAAVEQNINNDPNYQKGESTDGGKVDGKNKKTDGKSKKTEASTKKGFKKVASLGRKGKLELMAYMSSQKSKTGAPAWPIEYVEAMVGLKVSNLKDDEKTWFKNFWATQYPEDYVSEMVADR